ncbi:MAG: hypothetical protein LBB48_02450 [Treponema sp.]|jgi:hypothetical protein|nr:hypothetical protein [Treponema sp.]
MMTEDEKFMRKLRKVRTRMYEETKNMTASERVDYQNNEGQRILAECGISWEPKRRTPKQA